MTQQYTLKAYFSFFRWMYAYWLTRKWHNILNLTLGAVSVGLNLSFVYLFKAAIDIATGASVGNLSWILLLFVSGTIFDRVLSFVSNWIGTSLSVKTANDMRMSIYDKLAKSDWECLQKYHSGDIQGRISKDVDYLVAMTIETFPAIFAMIVQLIGAFIFLCALDARLALVLLVIAPIVYVLRRLYIKRQRELTHEVRKEDAFVLAQYQEASQHFLVIKTLEAYRQIQQRLSDAQQRLWKVVESQLKFSVRPFLVIRLGFDLTNMIVFVWGVVSLKQELITYGTLMAYVQLVARVQSPLKNISRYVSAIIQGQIAFERIQELEQLPSDLFVGNYEACSEYKSGRRGLDQKKSEGLALVMSNVCFRYSETERYIFDGFNAQFPPGSITAVLGETGSGKTTLVRLVLGLIHPQQGEIYWENLDDKEERCPLENRSSFSYVPQGNTLLSGTIRDNLLLAAPHATESQLKTALHVAAANFVFDLPYGLDTPCHEFGGGLSQGQAQRICIARAILRDSSVIILDECTSALDSSTEEVVIQRVVEATRGKTLIFITHRPAVLKVCTQVMKL